MRSGSDLHEPRTNAEQSETGGDVRVSYESQPLSKLLRGGKFYCGPNSMAAPHLPVGSPEREALFAELSRTFCEDWKDAEVSLQREREATFGDLYFVAAGDAIKIGRVRSHRHTPPMLLSPSQYADGYMRIGLWDGEHQKKHALHRLVAFAFHGDKRNALHNEVAHLDGNPGNCRADNLKWVSKIENHGHKRLHGTHQSGERHPRAKLTEANVIAIRHSSQSYRHLAEHYGVSWNTISDIRLRRRWRSVRDSAAIAPFTPV